MYETVCTFGHTFIVLQKMGSEYVSICILDTRKCGDPIWLIFCHILLLCANYIPGCYSLIVTNVFIIYLVCSVVDQLIHYT